MTTVTREAKVKYQSVTQRFVCGDVAHASRSADGYNLGVWTVFTHEIEVAALPNGASHTSRDLVAIRLVCDTKQRLQLPARIVAWTGAARAPGGR